MKTWTMPRVEVEAFSANEYVAGSCVNRFATDEAQIKALLDTKSGYQTDWDGAGSGGWGYDYNAEHQGTISTSTMNETMWKWGLEGPYMTWALLKEGKEAAANEMGFVTQHVGRYDVWVYIPVYFNNNGSGSNNRWHPSTFTAEEVNYS